MRKYLFICIIFCPFFSSAIDYQQYLMLHNSNQCGNYFEYFEQKHSIPQHLLRSISVVETGRWHKQAKIYLPWPWAVNQAGKAYYFATKNEAIEGVKKMLKKGLTNIDIGCMQINLHHHPAAFLNLNQAFEPRDNIEYAANFLKRHYIKSQDWQKAVAFYHSQASVGQVYANKVIKIWTKYQQNELAYSYCTSAQGDMVPCGKENKTSLALVKEKLYFSASNVTTTISEENIVKPRKSLKRLKSAMIPYSIRELN